MRANATKFLLVLALLVFAFVPGCSTSDDCMVSAPCQYCGATCQTAGLHAGACAIPHAAFCPVKQDKTTASASSGSGQYEQARVKAMEVIRRSPRCSGVDIPAGLAPTIKILGYSIDGPINFSSSRGTGKISEGEYIIMTQNAAGEVGDSAASHGIKDSRWNKYWGRGLKRFCVIWVADGRQKLLEWSEVVEVN